MHAYVWPFAFLYAAYAYAVLFHHDAIFGAAEGRNLALVILGSLNALVLLATQWSVTAKAWLTCYTVTDPFKAGVIRVIPGKHHGKGALCELGTQTIVDEEDGKVGASFLHGNLWS